MKLKIKFLLLITGLSISITGTLGIVLYSMLWGDRMETIRGNVSRQLQDVGFSIENFFEEVEGDVEALASNEWVLTRDDREFTSFLDADENSFQYRYGATERRIIGLFNAYRVTHRYVNSVYMGRENGSFVRSHERERPTRYDPRDRPWYLVGKGNPRQAMETDAYPSVTTSDVNIAVVKALVDEAGAVFGVVGVDVTLFDLTDYILNFNVSPAGNILLIDGKGTILASQENQMRSHGIGEYSPELAQALRKPITGFAVVRFLGGKHHVLTLALPRQDWKIAVLIPSKSIERQVRAPVLMTVGGIAIGFLLFTVLILFGLTSFVTGPLRRFTEETDRIAATADLDRRIPIHSRDEIGTLAGSYNGMIASLHETQAALRKNESDLKDHRNHLEELVKVRTGELQESNLRLKKEINERILAEQILIERETQYRDLVESANSIILRWRPDGKVVSFNNFAQEFFGYDEEEIIGQNIVGTIVPVEDSEKNSLLSLVCDIVAHPESHVRNVNENAKKNGERIWVAWANKPILAKNGEITEILSIGVDITQLVLTERELRRTLDELAAAKERAETADRLKSAFLATMSHELRTPLNSIIGFTGILLQGMVGPLNEEQKKQMDMVRGSSRHLLSLVNDVLDISKIEAGQLQVMREPVDLKASIRKVVQATGPAAGKKGLDLIVEVGPEIGTIRSDARRLEQILLNLLGNAVKFTEKGRIVVHCSTVPGSVVFRIEDTGIGIGNDEIDRLFQPFQQVDTGLTRKYEGTGLGLSISRKLVELLGGRIRVESEPGKGSVFSFSLPWEGGPS